MAADVIGRAILEIGSDTKDVKQALEDLKKQLRDTGKETESIGKNINLMVFKEFAEISIKAIGSVVGEIVEMGKHGADVSDVASHFDALTQRAGETAGVMIGELRSGVAGTISDFELMKLANKTLGSGLVTTSGDMKTLAAGARMLADRTGGDTSEAFETLTSAMASGKTAQLKQLGIFVDSSVATADYAKSLNKTEGQLTSYEKAQALSTAALAALRGELATMAPPAADFGEKIEQIKVRIQNFRDQLSVAISDSPVLAAGMEAMGQSFDAAFGSDQQGMVKVVIGYVNDFAIFLAKAVGIAVEGARFISRGWAGLNVMFQGLMFGIAGAVEINVKVLQGFVDFAAKLPGAMGAPFRAVQQSVRDVANEVEGARKSFAQQIGEELDKQSAREAAFDKVGKAVDLTVAAMSKAALQQDVVSESVRAFGAATKETERVADENAKKIAEVERKLQEELALAGRTGIDQRLTQMKFAQQKEIDDLKELKQLSGEQYNEMSAQIEEKYRKEAEAAQFGSDQVRDTTRRLQQELTLASQTGLQQRLTQIENEKQKELQDIANLKMRYGTEYTAIEALVKQKYQQMADAARGEGLTAQQLAAQAGFKSRAELQQTAKVAIETFNKMKESGAYNAAALRDAHEAAEEAKRAATGATAKYQLTSGQAVSEGAQQVLGVLGEKHKSAAIAGAVISTYMAVAKALASAPWPANLVLAAGALAAGMSNVSKIRSSDAGFKEGTPGLDFIDFGAMSLRPLHGEEAVVPKGKGHLLAGEIAQAMPDAGGGAAMLAEMRGLRDDLLTQLPRAIKRGYRDAMAMSPAR